MSHPGRLISSFRVWPPSLTDCQGRLNQDKNISLRKTKTFCFGVWAAEQIAQYATLHWLFDPLLLCELGKGWLRDLLQKKGRALKEETTIRQPAVAWEVPISAGPEHRKNKEKRLRSLFSFCGTGGGRRARLLVGVRRVTLPWTYDELRPLCFLWVSAFDWQAVINL